MLNGMSLAGISEFVHEINASPQEAQVVFEVAARLTPAGSAKVFVETIQGGSIRIPRRFRLRLSKGGREVDDPWLPSPEECVLAAMGSCALIVYVQALTLRGVPLNALEVVPHLELGGPDHRSPSVARIRHVGYRVSVDCDVQDGLLQWAARQVSRFSPNHRTIAEANPIDVVVETEAGSASAPFGLEHDRADLRGSLDQHCDGHVRGRDGALLAEAAPGRESRHSVRLRWRFGTQIDIRRGDGADARSAFESYEVDQPKQLLGIDRAPNPQEWLLAAIAGDLAFWLSEAAPAGEDRLRLRVRARGRLDLRGTLGVDERIPTKIQDLQLIVSGSSDDAEAVSRHVAKYLEVGVVSRLIERAQQLECDFVAARSPTSIQPPGEERGAVRDLNRRSSLTPAASGPSMEVQGGAR